MEILLSLLKCYEKKMKRTHEMFCLINKIKYFESKVNFQEKKIHVLWNIRNYLTKNYLCGAQLFNIKNSVKMKIF